MARSGAPAISKIYWKGTWNADSCARGCHRGGCVGASILYGLAKRGWSDVVLLERTQLTAGSTWHAAGLIPSYARNINIGRMINKSIEIYEGLEAETGQHVGWHKCGQLRIANTRDRLDEYKSYMSVAAVQGVRAELVSPARARELWPLLENNHDMLGALYHPDDGHIAPADVTMALAKGARDNGAKIYLNTEVKGFERLPSGEWKVKTNQGDIICEHIISATGNYARQTGAMLGLDIPAIPIIHQYWITDAVPEVIERKRQGLPEMPILRDEGFEGYLREEGDGLMFGPYERTEHLKLFAENGVPEWFGADLLEEDFDSVSWNWEQAIELAPALGRVGIKANVRGPFQMTADELPLVGPAWGWTMSGLQKGCPAASCGAARSAIIFPSVSLKAATASTHLISIRVVLATTPTRTGPAKSARSMGHPCRAALSGAGYACRSPAENRAVIRSPDGTGCCLGLPQRLGNAELVRA